MPARFPRLVLVEGGHDAWTRDAAKRFRAAGGDRVLFACGQPSCVGESKEAAARRWSRRRIVGRRRHGAPTAATLAWTVMEILRA